jgi:membrane-associated phospholipid phosphatase
MSPQGMLLIVVVLALAIPSASQTGGTDPNQKNPSQKDRQEKSISSRLANLGRRDADDGTAGFLEPGVDPENKLVRPFVKHMARDQMQFWTSVKDLGKPGTLRTFVPFVGLTSLLIASDSWMSKQVPDTASQLKRSKSISDYATYGMIGAAGGAFVLGSLKHNDRLSETGFLSGEAALNSTIVAYAFKEITRRQRPLEGNGNGNFFKGGSSFFSEHSGVAWSVASVVAHEYPGPLTQLAAYGLASAITLTRVTSKQHFPSDALVGSAVGWYFGRQIYRAHHDPELGGAAWGDFIESKEKGPRNPANMGSPYVPLDSWVYPAMERLVALGYVQSAYLGMRPWTRMQIAQMLEETAERIGDNGDRDVGEPGKIYNALREEFAPETGRLNGGENLGISLDSVYTRVTGISGTALRDGYHFGQTITNDYGRPYGSGFNDVTGISSHAVAGPFSFYVRGEYQHAPGSPAYSPVTQAAVANADFTLPVPNAVAAANQFRVIDASIAITFHDTQISFGKQSLWLGPGESGPLLFSNNAESLWMVKIDSVAPYRIPLLSSVLGPARSEYFLGRSAGHEFEVNGNLLLGPGNINPQPYVSGYKISFKPTPNFEFGMGITAQFAGPGLPFTWSNFLRTFYVHNQTGPTANNANPAKRLSAADFSYRVPGIRKWLTIYSDSLVVDEVSPIGSTRPTLNPGIYMPQIPKLPHLEFRAEGLKEPLTNEFAPGFVYYGLRRYRSGYTNDGNLMGNWIGRAGRGGQGWLTYSFSPHTRIQLGYRHQEVSKQFIGGGRSVDYSMRSDVKLGPSVALTGSLQYEQWHFPVLTPLPQTDVTGSIQLTFYPHWQIRK